MEGTERSGVDVTRRPAQVGGREECARVLNYTEPPSPFWLKTPAHFSAVVFLHRVANGQWGWRERHDGRFLNYYDIFVRNAFGNFRDVMREATYSPVMAMYLTYLRSQSFDSNGIAPVANYAREIMQLSRLGCGSSKSTGRARKTNRETTSRRATTRT